MATLTIRKIDDSIKSRLRVQAAKHNISMEEEVRRILRHVLMPAETASPLGSRIHQHFSKVGGLDEGIIPPRSMPRPTPDFFNTTGK